MSMASLDIDEALQITRPLGRTQIFLVIIVSLVNIEVVFTILSHVFVAAVPPHHCATGPLLNGSSDNYDYTQFQNETLPSCEEFIDPPTKSGTGEEVGEGRAGSESPAVTQPCSHGYQYNTEITGKSIVSEWDLVCSRDFLPELSQTILFIGSALGSIFVGALSDKYGRKPLAVVATFLFSIINISVSFSPNWFVYVSLKFLLGMTFKSMYLPLTTLLFEFLVPEYRSSVGNIPAPFFTVGLMLMAGLAYLVRDWRYYNLIMTSPALVIMISSWMIPESPRWLLSQGRKEEAEKVMMKVAKFNNASIEDISLTCHIKNHDSHKTAVTAVTFDQISIAETVTSVDGPEEGDQKTGSFVDLFKPPTLLVTVVLTCFWVTYTLGYFGFALTTGSLAGDPYLNFFLSGLVELPARTLPLLLVKRLGSLLPLMVGFALSSLTMIGVILVRFEIDKQGEDHELDLLLTMLSLLGKFFAAFVFVPSALLHVELFPTTMRNSGTGVVQLVGNIGSILSPSLIYLDKFVLNLPFIIMASTSLVSSGLCLLLPETLNTVQPETPADLQLLFDSKRFCRRKRNVADEARDTDGGSLQDMEAISVKTSCNDDPYQGSDNVAFEPDVTERE